MEAVAEGFSCKSQMEEPDGRVNRNRVYFIVGVGVGRSQQVAKYYAAAQMRTRLCEVLGQTPRSLLAGDRNRHNDPAVRKRNRDKRDRETALEEGEILEEPVATEVRTSSVVLKPSEPEVPFPILNVQNPERAINELVEKLDFGRLRTIVRRQKNGDFFVGVSLKKYWGEATLPPWKRQKP